MILQTEASECGLAALTMIGRYYGHDVDLASLRRRYLVSSRGTTLQMLMNAAAHLGFQSRPVRLELNELRQLAVPCILHWDLNHFVVLKQTHANGATIHDPACGVRRISNAGLSEHFTGVALECKPRADFEPVTARQSISLSTLLEKVDGLPGALMKIFGLAFALELITLIWPFYLQWVLDKVLVSADRKLLTLLGAAFLLTILLQAVLTVGRAWIITWLSTSLSVTWITSVFSRMLRLPLQWYEKRHIGDIASRYESLSQIQKTFTSGFVTAILDGLMAATTLTVLFVFSVKLTSVVLIAFLLYATVRVILYRPLRRAQEDQIQKAARQDTELFEAIRGALTLKINNQQESRSARYANAVIETFNQNIRMERLNIAFVTSKQIILGGYRVGIIWLAAGLVIDGIFSAGMLVAFVAYADLFINRVTSLMDKLMEFRMLGLHAERLADIVLSDTEQYIETDWSAQISDFTIEVRNVSFRYSSIEDWILKDCSMTVKAGEFVALTGLSGCGKTTLAKIILGLLEPNEGDVRLGGVDIRKLGLARYRSLIGAVMQEDQLFAGSVAENIASFPDGVFDMAGMESAARLAAIHDDISTMPMGYQSLVGDMGSTLSGGQKQRLLLARALYRNPKLLLLDEATSHLDIECEQAINFAISGLQVTRITIAHRPQTIASAQRVFLVAEGRVRELDDLSKESSELPQAALRA
jgi:ATP-binding cassette subfamily B protein RaxB